MHTLTGSGHIFVLTIDNNCVFLLWLDLESYIYFCAYNNRFHKHTFDLCLAPPSIQINNHMMY